MYTLQLYVHCVHCVHCTHIVYSSTQYKHNVGNRICQRLWDYELFKLYVIVQGWAVYAFCHQAKPCHIVYNIFVMHDIFTFDNIHCRLMDCIVISVIMYVMSESTEILWSVHVFMIKFYVNIHCSFMVCACNSCNYVFYVNIHCNFMVCACIYDNMLC